MAHDRRLAAQSSVQANTGELYFSTLLAFRTPHLIPQEAAPGRGRFWLLEPVQYRSSGPLLVDFLLIWVTSAGHSVDRKLSDQQLTGLLPHHQTQYAGTPVRVIEYVSQFQGTITAIF